MSTPVQTIEADNAIPQPFIPELGILAWQGRIFLWASLTAAIIAWHGEATLWAICWRAPLVGLLAMMFAGFFMNRGLRVIVSALESQTNQEENSQSTQERSPEEPQGNS